MIREIRKAIMENLPVIKIFNKLGGVDYAIYKRTTVIEGAEHIDYFVANGVKFMVDGHSNYMFTADRLEYDVSDIGSDDIVLDIGTTIGDFTILAALKAKHVYGVEPLFCKELNTNIKLNNCSNITLLPIALGDGTPVDLSFNKVERKNVPTFTFTQILDMIKEKYNDKITFLKCDCEGGEWYIKPSDLLGIRRIEIEIHPKMFPTESYNPELIPFIKSHWDVTITNHDDGVYVIHAYNKK
jgi:FkbM family methyltransferase